MLNLSVDTIWRYTREKRIPAIELGRGNTGTRGCILRACEERNGRGEERPYGSQACGSFGGSPGHARSGGIYLCRLRENQKNRAIAIRSSEGPGEGPIARVQPPAMVRELGRRLMTYFSGVDPKEFIFAPLDVTLTDRNVVQPDLMFVSSDRLGIIREERVDGPCYLLVEVMSPASRRRDRLQKMEIYRKAGIPHYWLADPEEKTLEAYSLRDGVYALVAAGEAGDIFTHPEFPELTLDLSAIFSRPS